MIDINSIDIQKLTDAIKKEWRTNDVLDVVIDDEFGCVTATIKGRKYMDCRNVDSYDLTNQ